MSSHRAPMFLLLAAVFCGGCDVSSPGAGTATVTGDLALSAYPGLDAPVVVAHGADGSYVSATVAADGSFRIAVPAGAPYRLSIAQLSARGTLVIVAHIRLSDDADWGRYERGGKVELGAIRPRPGQTPPYDDAYDHYGYDYDDHDACVPGAGDAELPYDVKLEIGDSFRLSDAFAEKGPRPAAIVSVTMDGDPWRLVELRADSTFVVSEADCEHAGNRDIGRDRIFVTWQNADGSKQTGHLDLRYCDSSSGGSGSSGSGNSGSGGGDKDSEDYAEDDAGCRLPPGETPPVCVPPAPPVSTCGEADLTHVTPLPEAPPHAESTCIVRDDPPPPPGEGTASGLELL